MNKAQLIGNLARDVELRNTPSGKIVGSVSIATNKTITDQAGNKNKVATFHNLVLWNKAAEIFAQYAHKGSKVYIEGEISNRTYDAQDGTKRYISEIIVSEFEFLDSKPATTNSDRDERDQASGNPHAKQTAQVEEKEIRIENIPF